MWPDNKWKPAAYIGVFLQAFLTFLQEVFRESVLFWILWVTHELAFQRYRSCLSSLLFFRSFCRKFLHFITIIAFADKSRPFYLPTTNFVCKQGCFWYYIHFSLAGKVFIKLSLDEQSLLMKKNVHNYAKLHVIVDFWKQ